MTTPTRDTTPRRASPDAPAALPDRLATTGVPLALGLLSTLVALLGSWNVSIWTDEAATISAARRTTAQLFQLVQNIDAVHAAYYFLIHFWGGLVGWSPVALRLPSAIAVGLTVVGVWALARALGRADVAVLAGVVTAVLPRVTWMGVEARSFGPSAAVAVWATVAFAVALRRGRATWIAYAALIGLGTTLNIYVALLAVAHVVTALLLPAEPGGRSRARRVVPVVVAAAAGGAVASPVVLAALRQKGQLGDTAVGVTALVRRVLVNQWFLGETPSRVSSTGDTTSPWSVAALLLAALGWALIVVLLVAASRGRARAGSRVLAFLLPWLLLPTVVVAAYTLAVSPIYNPRYFTFCAPAVGLLIACGIAAVPWRQARTGAVIAILVLALPIYLSQRQETGKSGTDWSSTAATVAAGAEKGDGVYFAPLDSTRAAVVERTTRNVEVAYPGAFRGLVDLTLTRSPAADDSLRGTSAQLTASAARLDGITSVWEIVPTGRDEASDEAFFAAHGFTAILKHVGPMDTVVHYRRS